MTSDDKANTLFMEARAPHLRYEEVILFYLAVMLRDARPKTQNSYNHDTVTQDMVNIGHQLETSFSRESDERHYGVDLMSEFTRNLQWASGFEQLCIRYINEIGPLPVVHFSVDLPKHIETTVATINSLAGMSVLINYQEV